MDFTEQFRQVNELIDRESEKLSTDQFEQQLILLLEALGNPDGEIRDDLAWRTFHRLFRSDLVSAHARMPLLETLMSDHYMFTGIEAGSSPLSVKRSFAILTMADIIWGDKVNSRLVSGSLLLQLSEELRRYIEIEQDHRGFDEELGWVHGIAHAGDLFLAMDQHPNLEAPARVSNVAAILQYIERREDQVFVWDEHFRLGRPIASCLLSIGGRQVMQRCFGRYSPDFMLSTPCRQNLLNTLRCVYLELVWEGGAPAETLGTLQRIIQ